jgi:hypothetical protein
MKQKEVDSYFQLIATHHPLTHIQVKKIWAEAETSVAKGYTGTT